MLPERPTSSGPPSALFLALVAVGVLGPDTVCVVMDPARSGSVLAHHAGIDEDTGQLAADEDGGPRRLVISSDFYAVYQSAGNKADGLVNLYCGRTSAATSCGQATRAPPS